MNKAVLYFFNNFLNNLPGATGKLYCEKIIIKYAKIILIKSREASFNLSFKTNS